MRLVSRPELWSEYIAREKGPPHLEIGREACRAIQSIPFHKAEKYYRSFIRDLRHWLATAHHRRGPPFSYRQMTPSWIRRRLKLAFSAWKGDPGQSALFLEFDGNDVDMPSANGQANRDRRQKGIMKALLAAFHEYEPATQPLLKYIIEHGGHRQYHTPSKRLRVKRTNGEEETDWVQTRADPNRRITNQLSNRAAESSEDAWNGTGLTEEALKSRSTSTHKESQGLEVQQQKAATVERSIHNPSSSHRIERIQAVTPTQQTLHSHELCTNAPIPISNIAQRAEQAQRRVASSQSLQERRREQLILSPVAGINPKTNATVRRLQVRTQGRQNCEPQQRRIAPRPRMFTTSNSMAMIQNFVDPPRRPTGSIIPDALHSLQVSIPESPVLDTQRNATQLVSPPMHPPRNRPTSSITHAQSSTHELPALEREVIFSDLQAPIIAQSTAQMNPVRTGLQNVARTRVATANVQMTPSQIPSEMGRTVHRSNMNSSDPFDPPHFINNIINSGPQLHSFSGVQKNKRPKTE